MYVFMNLQNQEILGQFYNDDFYSELHEEALKSADGVFEILWPLLKPSSVIDVGCGRGAWLLAAKNKGSNRLLGLDGHWNSQDKMMDTAIPFQAHDLELNFLPPERFDLAISTEVAEHLCPERAKDFVKNLVQCSDVVLFSAAIPGQGGDNHINEQFQSYWAKLFGEHNYIAFDFIRPHIWNREDLFFTYRQNCILYVNKNSPTAEALIKYGYKPVENNAVMDLIHPVLYKRYKSGERFLINTFEPLYVFIRKILPRKLFKNLKDFARNKVFHSSQSN
jgi:hypothetical protein